MQTIATLALAAAFGLVGCATGGELGAAGKEALRNDQGHVIGYKEILQNQKSGEVYGLVNLFRPVRDTTGDIIGYAEETRDGTIFRDLQGRPAGEKLAATGQPDLSALR